MLDHKGTAESNALSGFQFACRKPGLLCLVCSEVLQPSQPNGVMSMDGWIFLFIDAQP